MRLRSARPLVVPLALLLPLLACGEHPPVSATPEQVAYRGGAQEENADRARAFCARYSRLAQASPEAGGGGTLHVFRCQDW